MKLRARAAAPILLFLVAAGCAHHAQPLAVPVSGVETHENLHATLYVQTAAEYEAVALQTFRAARSLVEEALSRPGWTALSGRSTGDLPPAVIVDVDETVLDNSAYQARLILAGAEYDPASWKSWVDEAAAEAVPGALEFATWANSRGVTIFYVTNRDADEEPGTRRNLRSLGFPIGSGDVVLTKGEREGWGSDKETRREHVAATHRVVLLIGDDLGDFVPRTWTDVESRRAIIERTRERWGTSWLVIPNPTYGSWLSAVTYGEELASRDDRIEAWKNALEE
ncbi:MAG: 5'-nucleotidase, lipoprotein e(P4) family [Acidobacteria bacterium]|nr:5'-nucleotidase, lipoprotein e(P4) family [Acidobacteriota bacterium]